MRKAIRQVLIGVLSLLLAIGLWLDPRLAHAAPRPQAELPDAQVWEPISSTESELGSAPQAESSEPLQVQDAVMPIGRGEIAARPKKADEFGGVPDR